VVRFKLDSLAVLYVFEVKKEEHIVFQDSKKILETLIIRQKDRLFPCWFIPGIAVDLKARK